MRHRSSFLLLATIPLLLVSSPAWAQWKLDQMISEQDGKKVFNAKPIDDRFRNPWPEEYEREFQERARKIIEAQAEKQARGTTYFEGEKRYYGYLMAHVLGGNAEEAMKTLQGEDHQHEIWHRETEGIDFYAAFTLKHQMRKYFYFGDLMDPAYRKRMYQGGKNWTEKDPLKRPHYAYKKPIPGWGPDAKNSWVDVRSTENLFLMRTTSVYLMAEETGNKETTAKYKQIILDYAKSLYRVGIGEWDSENYHGHSMAPLCNLYDFAKDAEVKLAAKAALDWFCAAGAVKYYHGGFNGPGSRDYNHAQPFGGSAASMLWVYFGDCPRFEHEWESDEIHLITSAYRPPEAVVRLARKEIDRPVEIFASKPNYTATTSTDLESPPAYLETHYLANSYLLGTLSCGTPPGVSSVNGFKILVKDRAEGCAMIHAAPTNDPQFAGSPLYQKGKINAENRVAHYQNAAIWLARDGKSPWLWVVPEEAKVTEKSGVTFVECDETWLAVRPLGAGSLKKDDKLTQEAQDGKGARFAGHVVLSTRGDSRNFSGMAVEIGEKQSHKSFANFQKSVLAGELDLAKLDEGVVVYRTGDGKNFGFHWQDDPRNLGVWRNGERHDWEHHAQHLYQPAGAEDYAAPIFSRWGEGGLYVEAGGNAFYGEVDDDGQFVYLVGNPENVRPKTKAE